MPRIHTSQKYHHGDLRGALIAAAEQLLSEKADGTFTLREVARVAGVSHNAPYNHFTDRRALLAAIAARGFDGLTVALKRALDDVNATDMSAGIRAIAKAYVAFAVAHQSSYRLMFSAELAGHEDGDLKTSGEKAFSVLRELIANGVGAGRLRPDENETHALTAWSLVHGLGTLAIDGKVPIATTDPVLAALTETIAETLVVGLALPQSPGD